MDRRQFMKLVGVTAATALIPGRAFVEAKEYTPGVLRNPPPLNGGVGTIVYAISTGMDNKHLWLVTVHDRVGEVYLDGKHISQYGSLVKRYRPSEFPHDCPNITGAVYLRITYDPDIFSGVPAIQVV